MSELITFEKKETWVQIPHKEKSTDYGHVLYNAYTTTLLKGKPVEISTGVIFPERPGCVAFIMGKQHTDTNRNVAVNYNFAGAGELKFTCVNYGEDDVELLPLTKLTDFIVLKVAEGEPVLRDKLDETVRGERGFGSTGF